MSGKSPAAITDELRAARSRAGKLGAASKWGGQRIVRLDRLDPDTSRLIRALLAQTAVTTGENVVTAKEVRRASDADSSSE
jgi:hypothetical protein